MTVLYLNCIIMRCVVKEPHCILFEPYESYLNVIYHMTLRLGMI